jgi:alpha-beta hydrolase superfamily lysophospholipase
MTSAPRDGGQSRTPVLIQLAGDDRVVSTAASRDLATRLGGATRVLEYDDAYHDLYLDPAGERAATDLVGWIEEILAEQGAREPL